MTIDGKPYIKIIKEDLSKYLINSKFNPLTNQYTYRFSCSNNTDLSYFKLLTGRYECWRYLNPFIYTWTTKSTFLHNMYKTIGIRKSNIVDLKEEKVEDIPANVIAEFNYTNPCMEILTDVSRGIEPSHMLDANKYMGQFKQEYECKFNEKEKEMKSNKFSVNYKIDIHVNNKVFLLVDPVKSDDALDVVLELTNRLNFLSDQLKTLENINTVADTSTDTIDVSKVTEVLTDEMGEIKEVIDYINSNIE